jgi:aspartate aminotransferase
MLKESDIPQIPTDPLFLLQSEYKQDSNPKKINLGIGAYKTEDSKPYLFESVKKAETDLLKLNLKKEYLPILGNQDFIDGVLNLIFKNHQDKVASGQIWGAQTLGGTGALSVAAQTFSFCGISNVALSSPSWVNHEPIFSQGKIKSEFFAYFNKEKMSLDKEALFNHIKSIKEAILLQVTCHNPTGVDLSEDDWKKLLTQLKSQQSPIIFDLAYHGFKEDIEEALFPLEFCLNQNIPFLLAYSFSKNMGLYGERLGCFASFNPNSVANLKIKQVSKRVIRSNYSNPPIHGALIAAHIFSSKNLFSLWVEEVKSIKRRIKSTRKALEEALILQFPDRDFSFMNKQNGMFSFLPLSKEEVEVLKKKHSIYLPSSGRVNIAGLNSSNLEVFISALKTIWKNK